MAWLELHTVLIRHRKLNKLARTLNIKPVVAVGHVTTLWGNVLELSPSGDITKWDLEDISTYANWEGDPETFYKALLNGGDGFIDERDGFRLIHDWLDYAGKYLTSKYHTRQPEVLANIRLMYCKDQMKTKVRPNEDQNALPTNLTNQPTITLLLEEFYNSYRQKVNKDYVKEPHKDRSIMKMLIGSVSSSEISELIKLFFNSNDNFINTSGLTLGVFKSVINKLRTNADRKIYV